MKKITGKELQNFEEYLRQEEKSQATVEKYLRDLRKFLDFLGTRELSKGVVMEYKAFLLESNYAAKSINSMLASLNSFLGFLGRMDCKAKSIRLQKCSYMDEEKELTKAEYLRLLEAAKENHRLYLAIQAICSTGIRVSELRFFTVENLKNGRIVVNCKGKIRRILLPGKLRKLLLDYAKKKKIYTGAILLGKSGKPLDRRYIWAKMKKLCRKARVNSKKVFPHNLRKLFAKCFYKIDKDIAKLADLLGHSSIETTRIYIMTTDREHRRKIEHLGLLI